MAEQEELPLAGKRIVITRAVTQSEGLADALRAQGAEPVLFPLIRIVPIKNYGELEAGLARLRDGDWIILTSQNAVAPVADCAIALRRDFFGEASGILVAAVGPATEKAARAAGVNVDYLAQTHDGVSLATELKERLRGHLALLPRSDLAGTALPVAIHKIGGEAIEVVAYHTEHVPQWEGRLADMIVEGSVDAVVCFSPSAVTALMDLLSSRNVADVENKVVFVAIGAITAQAFRMAGIRQPLVAIDASTAASVNVLSKYFAERVSPQNAGVKHS